MTIRFTDNILRNIEGTNFIIRNRVPKSVQIILTFIAAFDFICLAFYLTDDSGVPLKYLAVLVITIALLGYATFFFFNRFRKLILATEFQTAMLASAAQLGTRFCFIVNRDGLIFYIDPGFQRMFTSFVGTGSRTLQELLIFIQLGEDTKERIYTMLKRDKSDKIMLSFNDPEGNPVSAIITIDALPRPKGYYIIRGRDYVEKRAGETDESKSAANSMLLLEKSLYGMQGGALVADNKGKLLLVSQDLEKFLGYGQGEVDQLKIGFEQIVHQYTGHSPDTFLLNDFDGQVTLKRRNGMAISLQACQRLVGDESHTLGISMVVNLDKAKL